MPDYAAYVFEMDGVSCRRIDITKGQFCIVWESDYEWLTKWRWCATWYPQSGTFYAVRAERTDGRKYILSMHRQILGLGYGDKSRGDHINGNTLDNRRSNLRICSHQENLRNRGRSKNNKTGFKGVTFEHNGFVAQATVDGKRIYLGRRKTPEEAYGLYVSAMKDIHGAFWREEA